MSVDAFLKKHPDIKFIDLLIADSSGLFRSKRIPRSQLAKVCRDGIDFASSLFSLDASGDSVDTVLGLSGGDPDSHCLPLPDTLCPVPWDPSRAQLLLTMVEADGSPHFADPRQILGRILDEFTAATGLVPDCGFELEFMLVERGDDGLLRPPGGDGQAYDRGSRLQRLYSADDLERRHALLDEIVAGAPTFGLDIEGMIAESGPSQYELNLVHRADVIRAADEAVLLKHLIRGCARAQGLTATFMARPISDLPGSGMHLHLSLLDGRSAGSARAGSGANVFAAPPGQAPEQGSDTLQHAVAGLLATMAEAQLLAMPTVNSYRRLEPDIFVPLGPSWAYNNRSAALRIPVSLGPATRIEYRLAGADANPYLLLAALLAGVRHGIDGGLRPPAQSSGNAGAGIGPPFATSLDGALKAFVGGQVVAPALGADYAEIYRCCRQHELDYFRFEVSPREVDFYLDI